MLRLIPTILFKFRPIILTPVVGVLVEGLIPENVSNVYDDMPVVVI